MKIFKNLSFDDKLELGFIILLFIIGIIMVIAWWDDIFNVGQIKSCYVLAALIFSVVINLQLLPIDHQ
ncbi:hypothetical protein M2T79_18670 [Elizabethkingia miricola]|uniref:hypothetical protein n=1 Tax=Elizabethkingia miricola TaxID=172045 RepID=UPI0020198D6A|nr:hypothetical protein [Elizabethkingia miricola]MCL1658634.1 hypothetical protein [Elizabethkingia miricola]